MKLEYEIPLFINESVLMQDGRGDAAEAQLSPGLPCALLALATVHRAEYDSRVQKVKLYYRQK